MRRQPAPDASSSVSVGFGRHRRNKRLKKWDPELAKEFEATVHEGYNEAMKNATAALAPGGEGKRALFRCSTPP